MDRETLLDSAHQLISSARVEGTPVLGPDGVRLGDVHSVMIHKRTGQAAYALLSFGGFLGLGQKVHPIPWEMLRYDQSRGGYIVDVTRDQLKDAPVMHLDQTDRPCEVEKQVYTYWESTPYW